MKQHKSIKIEQQLIDKVNAEAKKENRSFNNKVEVILNEHFDFSERKDVFIADKYNPAYISRIKK